MSTAYWLNLQADGLAVPADRRLDDLTAELTAMLGSPDPVEREEIAVHTLSAWLERGVYDDLLAGLGDGMAAGLVAGQGESDTLTVFRRASSARMLGRCLARDNARSLVPAGVVLDWGDRLASWIVRERDLRGEVDGHGWAGAVAHGAQALGHLASSPHLGAAELTVILDVLADRLDLSRGTFLVSREPDWMAWTVLAVLRRGLVLPSVVEPWMARVAAAATPSGGDVAAGDPWRGAANEEAFLRALHIQLGLTREPIPHRHNLVLSLTDILRETNQGFIPGAPA